MGLRARLAIIVALGLGVSFVASLVLLVRLEQRTEYREAAERTGALLHTVAVPAALLLTQGRLADLDNLMVELTRRQEILDLSELILLDTSGRVIAHSDPDRYGTHIADDSFVQDALASPRPLVERTKGFPSRVAVPVQTGIRWGTLVGTLSQPRVTGRVRETQLRLVAIAVAVASLGLVALFGLLSLWVVRPVRSLTRAAQALSRGDLTVRAPAIGGGELAILAGVMNDAAEQLGRYTQELEAAVDKRTSELARANDELREANERLEQLAITDGLTGLFNHRHFFQLLHQEIERQQRARRPFSVIMIDVDHFKHYNDSWGHPDGDEVLKTIAALLKEAVRRSDVVARYGGEEFIVLLLESTGDDAFQRADALRLQVAGHNFPHGEDQPLGRVSISVGVATWPDDGTTARQVVAAADAALYRSKRRGRNLVTMAAAVDPPPRGRA